MPRANLSLDDVAAVLARTDRGERLADVLAERDVEAAAWAPGQQQWLELIAARAQRGNLQLAQRYIHLYWQHVPTRSLPEATERAALALPAAVAALVDAAPVKPPVSTRLSCYEYAMLCAEISASPDDAPRVWGKYGLGGPDEQAAESDAWEAKIRSDHDVNREFQGFYRDAERHWRSLRRR